jgi:ParB/RepB/Spo0J family partition protein
MQIRMEEITAGNAHNSRTDEPDIKTLVKSLHENGLILPIAVRFIREDGAYQVIDGHRRFAAAKELGWGFIEANVISQDGDVEAATLSLVANIERLPLHPVDQFEAFAKLRDAGLKEKDIARKFAISKKQVKQAMALGNLHAAVLQAWKVDKIDEEAAAAFALATPSQQFEVLAKLKKQKGEISRWMVKKEIGLFSETYMLDAVGEEAFLAAGGEITIDLFAEKGEDDRLVSNTELLQKLYDEKRKAENPEPEDEAEEKEVGTPYADHANIPKPEPRSTEERPLSGQITKALEESVLAWRTRAYQETFSEQSDAFLHLIVNVGQSQWCSAFQFSRNLEGKEDWRELDPDGDIDTRISELAIFYSECINTKTCTDKDMDVLASYLDTFRLRRNLVNAFEADEYFERCNIKIITAAIEEMGQPTDTSLNKKSLVKVATKLALDTQWLPPLMRAGGLEPVNIVQSEAAE